MDQERFTTLFHAYLQKTYTDADRKEFLSLVTQPEYHPLLRQLSDQFAVPEGQGPALDPEVAEAILQSILALPDLAGSTPIKTAPVEPMAPPVHRVHFLRRGFFRYAAAIIILFGSGIYLWITHRTPHTDPVPTVQSVPVKADIAAPRTNRATLTLSNGQQIFLDSVASGTLARQGHVQIEKTSDGRIAYKGQETSVQYNTLSVPRGSDIASIVLADGSKVFLNAASSLRYPVAFVGNERKVEITGEAYFEVAKNKQPFIVETGTTQITVLGTHFNVNAYAEEGPVKTTLLEGRVQVSREGYSKVLAPGQQESEGKIISNIDTESVMAWKNGIFRMEKADIATILRQVSRWYDVNVVYADGMIPVGTLSGEVSKQLNLSEVAEVLRLNGVAVQVEGTNLIVRKK